MARETHCDVAVIGAGAAGIAAAATAGRLGASVCLVDARTRLGGTATHALLTSICGLYEQGSAEGGSTREPTLLECGFAREFSSRLRRLDNQAPVTVGPVHILPYRTSSYLRVCEDLLDLPSRVRVSLAARVVGARLERGADGAVLVGALETVGDAGFELIRPKMVVDCSGDGVCAELVSPHVDFEMAALETLQCPAVSIITDGANIGKLGPGWRTQFWLAIHHRIRDGRLSPWLANLDLAPIGGSGKLLWKMNIDPLVFAHPSEILQETSRDAVNARGLKALREAARAVAESVGGFETSVVEQESTHLGVRESRRLVGAGRLTETDLRVAGGTRTDGVAVGAWPVEIWHRQQPMQLEVLPNAYYDIPYACFHNMSVVNLLFAGRCLSATHWAHASARVIGCCFSMGQGVGAAATLAAGVAAAVQELEPEKIRMLADSVHFD